MDEPLPMDNFCMISLQLHFSLRLFASITFDAVSELSFLRFFEQFGEVIDSVVMIDRTTKRSRGFGFVTFASEVRFPLDSTFYYGNSFSGHFVVLCDATRRACEVR